MSKVAAFLCTVVLLISVCAVPAMAIDAGERRVTIGADLTEEQVDGIYSDFGLSRGDVTEIKVTNDEEREYLEGLVSESKIGRVALSCTYIMTLDKGEGLSVSTNKINWCTEDMYKNALTTAGITDASVMVSAPREVSGTAALTGIYKAYEDITGEKLDAVAKQVGAEELVVTGDLADAIGSVDAAQIVNQLKEILDQAATMSDDEVRQEIRNIGKQYGQELTDSQVEQLLSLVRSMQGLDADELQKRLESLQNTYNTANNVGNFFSDLGKKVSDFFKSVGDFFSNIFGGK